MIIWGKRREPHEEGQAGVGRGARGGKGNGSMQVEEGVVEWERRDLTRQKGEKNRER